MYPTVIFFFKVFCPSALRRKIHTKPHLYQNLFSTYVLLNTALQQVSM